MGSIIELPKAGLSGEYRMVARKLDGSERLLADWFSNNIVEDGLDNLINSGWKQYCQVGTGTVAASDTDAALITPILSTSAISNVVTTTQGASPYYTQSSCDYTFPVGAGTYTEVGVASGPHTGSFVLFSRALIVDGLGAPTAITTLADEYLVVTYRLRMYPNVVDTVGLIGIGSDTHEYTIRAFQVTNNGFGLGHVIAGAGRSFLLSLNDAQLYMEAFSGNLGAVTGAPTGDLGLGEYAATLAYVPGSRQVLANAVASFSEANGAGFIRSLRYFASKANGNYYGWYKYQIGFVPDIPKNSGIQLTFTLGAGWGRYVAP